MKLLFLAKFRGLISIIAGAIAGYAYWYYVGCSNGTCPISSVWYISTAYGALLGYTLTELAKTTKTQAKT
ncbi:MAG: DUF6132 family protein [Microscillaceae bacterium]|jgi:hypothetical protein|nr:DUF6132 family protein [Microscillaceae bacterium]